MHSLPTHKYNNNSDNFRRYSVWLRIRNYLIKGFIKDDDNYYMVAYEPSFYSRYGFCTACGILRCSPVWCICGHKKLSDGWSSNNEKLDEFIKNSQLQTNSANDAYLDWIPFDCVKVGGNYESMDYVSTYEEIKLIPVEITNETDYLYYNRVSIKYEYIMLIHC